jgi:hypothetical protein
MRTISRMKRAQAPYVVPLNLQRSRNLGPRKFERLGSFDCRRLIARTGGPGLDAVSSQIFGDQAIVTITSTDARKLLVVVRATTRRTALNDAALRDGKSSMVVDIAPYRNLDNEAIARAIVLQASREWIFNAQLPAAKSGPISALPTGLRWCRKFGQGVKLIPT